MKVVRKRSTLKGPEERFTGDVWLDPIAAGESPRGVTVSAVHFHPGARTAWHTHPSGQTLYVTEGHGLVQSKGEPVVEIGPGDVVVAPDGEEHWHGAGPDTSMTHLSITLGDASWGKRVSANEYHSPTE